MLWAGRILAVTAAALACASCGGDDSGSGGTPSPSPTQTPTPTPSPTPTSGAGSATVSYLHVFSIAPDDGAQPNGPLLQASDGNFYGTTLAGGANTCRGSDRIPCGVIFRIMPNGNEVVLHSFGASATDGYTPNAPLIQGKDGALYGTTASGGLHGGGTIYRITLSGDYTVLYSFGASATDGVVPVGGVIQAVDGTFYGTTASGGANHCIQIPQAGSNCGTVFKLTADGKVTILYSFGNSPSDGVEPQNSLLQASDGNFYGTTLTGGAGACGNPPLPHNCGTVFRITPEGVVTILHSFAVSPGDGVAPQGPLIQGRDGALYGTTPNGGANAAGTVFRMPLSGGATVLYSFGAVTSDGRGPSPFLIQAKDGNFYGSTRSGGTFGGTQTGTIFRVTPAGTATTLHSFGPLTTTPSDPLAGVIEGADGALYGVTAYNGQLGAVGARGGAGTLFKLMR